MFNIIWLCDRDNSWERDWIEFLFNDIPHVTTTDYKFEKKIDNRIVVFNSTVKIEEYLEKFGYDLGLIHLSDEYYNDSRNFYSKVKFVLRNYFIEETSNVMTIPLGWNIMYPYNTEVKTVYDRKYVWSFTGHVEKTTRPAMAHYMSTVPNGMSYFKKSGQIWGPFLGHACNPTQMAELYNDSIFVPSPRGNFNQDTFRTTEALQMGAIPIVESDPYWEKLFGPNPLLMIDDWAHAPQLINDLMKDLNSLENLRISTYTWWTEYLVNLKNKIGNFINENH